MANEESLPDVLSLGFGLVTTPLCARKSLTPEEAAARYTEHNPPGTSLNQWVLTEEADLPEGFWGDTPEAERVYPLPCNEFPDQRQHLLVHC